MKTLLALLLPATIMAQAMPVGNPAGVVLGIFAMCGTNPVDCGNGWCCMREQSCVDGPNGPSTMCADGTLEASNGQSGVIINAAYFGRMQQHQADPGNGSVPSKTTFSGPQQVNSGSSNKPNSRVVIGAAVAALAIAASSF